ncbi:MAG: hypothetical protein AB2826_25720 [Candidatus Thiodiazotropha sp.]
MLEDIHASIANISKMSSEDSENYIASIAATSRNDLVDTQWSVEYNKVGHDMISIADVYVVNKGDALLQVWLRNAASGIWIPELQPWEISAVEFKPEQLVTSTKLGLFDSKWSGDDIGREYHYKLWGFVLHGGKVESFAFDKWSIFPEDPS